MWWMWYRGANGANGTNTIHSLIAHGLSLPTRRETRKCSSLFLFCWPKTWHQTVVAKLIPVDAIHSQEEEIKITVLLELFIFFPFFCIINWSIQREKASRSQTVRCAPTPKLLSRQPASLCQSTQHIIFNFTTSRRPYIKSRSLLAIRLVETI